jgi:hypothetical protein
MPDPSRALSPEEKWLVEEEEERAWAHGREVLVELGMVDLSTFNESRADARDAYRKRLWGS